jgi:HAD superfamily hydrolase (TIGR01509 family)
MVKAVIFDIDGTLIDSVDLHARAWQEIFLRYGVKTDFQKVRDQIGKGGDKLMKVFLANDQIENQGKEIQAEREKLFMRKYLPQVKPFPRLRELFEKLREDDLKIALASSAKDEELQAYKKLTGIEPFLAKATSSDDVAGSKPDPDIFRSARKKLGIDPEEVIAVGDTRYDVESAGKAGMSTIGVLCGGSSAGQLKAAGSIALYQDPADLLRNYSTSPLVQHSRPKSKGAGRSVYFLLGLGVGATLGAFYAIRRGVLKR